ncbi:hypothetical protein PM8797T_25211 [Gimesia maris DSM 8797]|nr:hypothetical protein PM8797T_25211 [Gimesia maris DSM 8797]
MLSAFINFGKVQMFEATDTFRF